MQALTVPPVLNFLGNDALSQGLKVPVNSDDSIRRFSPSTAYSCTGLPPRSVSPTLVTFARTKYGAVLRIFFVSSQPTNRSKLAFSSEVTVISIAPIWSWDSS